MSFVRWLLIALVVLAVLGGGLFMIYGWAVVKLARAILGAA